MNKKFTALWATKTSNDEWWSSFVTAPAGLVLNYIAVEIPWITPNRITVASFLVAVVAAFAIISDQYGLFVFAAILIHFSHILDCMDGQMARYRKVSSVVGSYFDRLTDQLQVIIWFGAAGYAAYLQTMSVVPVLLAMTGIAFYGLRGYVKYVVMEIETARDANYPTRMAALEHTPPTAGLDFGIQANLIWFAKEQRKIFNCNEGVFIFMLSAALILNQLEIMLWIFAGSQLFWGLYRAITQGLNLQQSKQSPINK